jgi:hypothetical protein
MDHITYYDFNYLYFSSFFVTGFLENAATCHYRFKVSNATPGIISDSMNETWRSILFSVCVFKANLSGEEFFFCIDTRDSSRAGSLNGNGYHLPLLAKVKYYFKVNYNKEAIRDDPDLEPFVHKIFPALPFFPLRSTRPYMLMPRIRPCAATGWKMRNAAQRLKALYVIPTLDYFIQLRKNQKSFDIFFLSAFYPEERHRTHMDHRLETMKEIRRLHRGKSLVGFAARGVIPRNFAEFQVEPHPMKEYLDLLSRSKIAIYVVGLHDCLSFKLGQYLALGLPIIGQRIRNNADAIMTAWGFDQQFAFEDPKEIAYQTIVLLHDNERRVALGLSNADEFDRRFTPTMVTLEILRHMYPSFMKVC